jgi:hypothetical protein
MIAWTASVAVLIPMVAAAGLWRHRRRRDQIYSALAATQADLGVVDLDLGELSSTGSSLAAAFSAHRLVRVEQFVMPLLLARLREEALSGIQYMDQSFIPLHFTVLLTLANRSNAGGVSGTLLHSEIGTGSLGRRTGTRVREEMGRWRLCLLSNYQDMFFDPKANDLCADYIKRKIRSTVKDPRTAEKLIPKGRHTSGDLRAALGRVKAKTFVMPMSSDMFFSPADCQAEWRLLPDAEFRPIQTIDGHLALFGADPGALSQLDKNLNELLATKV